MAVARAFKPLKYDPTPSPPSTWTRGSESIQYLMPYNRQLMGLGAVALVQRSLDEIDDQLIGELQSAILGFARHPDVWVAEMACAAPVVAEAARAPVSDEAYARYIEPWVVEFPDEDYRDVGLDASPYTSGLVFFHPQAQIGMYVHTLALILSILTFVVNMSNRRARSLNKWLMCAPGFVFCSLHRGLWCMHIYRSLVRYPQAWQ